MQRLQSLYQTNIIFRLAVAAVTLVLGTLLLSQVYHCPFLWFTGIPCPGCGMTRAFLALVQGDFLAAFGYHPLFLLVLVYAGILLISWAARSYRIVRSRWFTGIFITAMLLHWGVVLLRLGTDGINPDAPLQRLLQFVLGG